MRFFISQVTRGRPPFRRGTSGRAPGWFSSWMSAASLHLQDAASPPVIPLSQDCAPCTERGRVRHRQGSNISLGLRTEREISREVRTRGSQTAVRIRSDRSVTISSEIYKGCELCRTPARACPLPCWQGLYRPSPGLSASTPKSTLRLRRWCVQHEFV
mgnify:CR=1 FL=1